MNHPLDRDDNAIADAVASLFPVQGERLSEVHRRLHQLPGPVAVPVEFPRLYDALEKCLRSVRQSKPTVKLLKHHLDALNDGIRMLDVYRAELPPEAIQAVRQAADVRDHQVTQLREIGELASRGREPPDIVDSV